MEMANQKLEIKIQVSREEEKKEELEGKREFKRPDPWNKCKAMH